MSQAFVSGGQVECGVTQDKSTCVQWATITNGGGAFMRVRPRTRTSRGNNWIIGQNGDLARVGFVQTMYDKWHGPLSFLNDNRQSSAAMWCIR